MRSHLSRNVYRRLLSHHGSPLPCLSLSAHPLAQHSARQPRPLIRRPSRRTFFNIFQKPPRELKEAEIEPGYVTLLQFRSLEVDGIRLPPRDELLQGFRTFFNHKLRHKKPLNSTQAFLAVRLLRHLVEELTLQDLRSARDAVLMPPKEASPDHLELSINLYEEIRKRAVRGDEVDESQAELSIGGLAGEASAEDFKQYITAVTQYGGSVQAAARLTDYWQKLVDGDSMYKGAKALWVLVLRGLAREGREQDLVREAEKAENLGVEYMPPFHEVMTTFFASRDRVEDTKRWFDKPIYGKWLPTPETYKEVLKLSLRNGQQQWVQTVFQSLCDSNPHKALWDVIFQWAVLALDKGVDDVKQMMETMVQHTQDDKRIRPDTATINGLVAAAIEKKDPYLAERFIVLGNEMGIAPDATTYILQMDYRIDAKDLGGARAAYSKLENSLVSADEDLPVVNKFIRALCAVEPADTERILDLTGAVEQRHVALEPDTVVALCMVFLKTDQQYEVIDTLSLHTVQYSLEEREKIEKAFVSYCLDRKNSTARVWDAYSLLRQFFPETDPSDRVLLMNAFFDRKRPDMACHVFGHMRAHANPSQRPTSNAYVQCLEGLGRCPDMESLRMVHNMLKMDTTAQMETRIYNALMIAYAGCDDASTALDFWSDITNSAEGPTYNSLAIVFRACEVLPFGDRKAREVWDKMQRMELEVPPFVFSAYCGAIAGQGHVEQVKRLILGMDSGVGYPPNLMT